MARIRTIKPEFFTSEDIVSLSPLARLLFIALWCEADREGRLAWRPKTFKLRYLPADKCDAEALCDELVRQGVVVLYGDGLAFIPSFTRHQHVNPREVASSLPEPDASARVGTRANPDVHVQVGKEGKGKEGEGREGERGRSPSGSRLAPDWNPTVEDLEYALKLGLDAGSVLQNFRDYWLALPGGRARKLDWSRTWQRWCRTEAERRAPRAPPEPGAAMRAQLAQLASLGRPPDERPPPDDAGETVRSLPRPAA